MRKGAECESSSGVAEMQIGIGARFARARRRPFLSLYQTVMSLTADGCIAAPLPAGDPSNPSPVLIVAKTL
jgi:hypothetical protein